MALIEQEVTAEREVEIPGPVRDVYRAWRPTPLIRAHKLEQALDTPARIFYKYEGHSPSGSHKPNTAVAQAFYNHDAGVARVEVSLQDTATGLWWNPKTSAWRTNRAWDTAFAHGPSSSMQWRYTFQGAHPGGRYNFTVRTRDRAGLVSPVVSRQLRAD